MTITGDDLEHVEGCSGAGKLVPTMTASMKARAEYLQVRTMRSGFSGYVDTRVIERNSKFVAC